MSLSIRGSSSRSSVLCDDADLGDESKKEEGEDPTPWQEIEFYGNLCQVVLVSHPYLEFEGCTLPTVEIQSKFFTNLSEELIDK